MSLSQAIGVIFGANIGTTVTAQIIAFKVTKFSLLFVAIGFVMVFISKNPKVRHYGSLIMGLGLVFFGLAVMSDAMKPLRSYDPFIALMRDVANPFIGVGIAALFTALVQSSSATTGVVIAMATQGLISLEAGIAMILGANIGTCVTAGLAAIGKPREAVRVALAHVSFNVGGVVLAFAFIPYLADLVRTISPSNEELDGMARLAAETPRQIANAHTVFNIFFSLFFLPFASILANFCERVLPDLPLTEEELIETIIKPRYLDEELIETPALALGRVRLEIGRLGEQVVAMHEEILDATLSRDREQLQQVEAMDESVDTLHRAIIRYLRKIRSSELSEEQGSQFVGLMEIANNFENIGDIIETDLVTVGTRTIDENIVISAPTREVLSRFHEAVGKSVDMALIAATEQDDTAAQDVIDMKARINALADAAALHGAQRLIADEPNRSRAYSREMEMIEKYKRIYYFAKRIAKAVLATPDEDDAEITETSEPEGAPA